MIFIAWAFSIISGMADAGSRNIIKLTDIPGFVLIGAGFMFALPWYVIWLTYTGIPEIKSGFWPVIAMDVPLMILAFILTIKAHRSSPFMLTTPYLALTPAFLLITAPLMGGGTPSSLGILGVVLITIGIYVLNTKQGQAGLLDPFRQIIKESGSILMIMVSLIFAITANFDYLALISSNAPFYLLVDQGLVCIVCIPIIALDWSFDRYRKDNNRQYKNGLSPRGIIPLALFGFALAISVIPQMLALEWIANVPYVIAGKRAGIIFFTVISGFVIASMKRFGNRYEEEKSHLRYRIPGTAVITTGMTIIILYG